jgi:hypothetical protein
VDVPVPAHKLDAAPGAAVAALFAEELGLVLEVSQGDAQRVVDAYTAAGVTAAVIGKVCACVRVEKGLLALHTLRTFLRQHMFTTCAPHHHTWPAPSSVMTNVSQQSEGQLWSVCPFLDETSLTYHLSGLRGARALMHTHSYC